MPLWALLIPIVAIALLAASLMLPLRVALAIACVPALMGAVIAAVHHAEVVAHRVGEPFGTLVLAVAITIIEVALIVSMMLAGERQLQWRRFPSSRARDVVLPTGRSRTFRPLRRWIWMGTEMVRRPSLANVTRARSSRCVSDSCGFLLGHGWRQLKGDRKRGQIYFLRCYGPNLAAPDRYARTRAVAMGETNHRSYPQ